MSESTVTSAFLALLLSYEEMQRLRREAPERLAEARDDIDFAAWMLVAVGGMDVTITATKPDGAQVKLSLRDFEDDIANHRYRTVVERLKATIGDGDNTASDKALMAKVADLALEGLVTDGVHHKQWYLEQIARLVLGDDAFEERVADEYEPGIPP